MVTKCASCRSCLMARHRTSMTSLYLSGIDAAITQSDALEYFRTERKTPNLENRVNYILRLPLSEIHIVAKRDIRSLEDLRGKKVSFGPAGAGSSLTGAIIFQRLGIKVDAVHLNAPVSLQKVRSGEIAAMVRAVSKPINFFQQVPADANLHLVPIPFSKKFADYYSLGEFTHKDYPTLVPENGRIDTIAVPLVLAVYNWKKDGDRYRRVERFVQRLFQNWDKLQKPPYHPKWRDVNLAATVPGWQRFSVAETELGKIRTAETPEPQKSGGDFQAYLNRSATRANPRTAEEREALFRAYLKWRDEQKASRDPQRCCYAHRKQLPTKTQSRPAPNATVRMIGPAKRISATGETAGLVHSKCARRFKLNA